MDFTSKRCDLKKRKERMNTNKDGEHSCINNNCGVKQSKGELNWNICFNLDTVITPWITKVHENVHLVGGFNHHEKYESMGRIIPYIMEKKHVWNHQPVIVLRIPKINEQAPRSSLPRGRPPVEIAMLTVTLPTECHQTQIMDAAPIRTTGL